MQNLYDRLTALRNSERGMSLIEVVVAIVILGTLTTVSLGIFLTSLNASTSQQRRQIAITVANETMESVSAWQVAKSSTTGVSALYTGRSQAAVQELWAANPAVSGVAQTYPAWDPLATPTAVPDLPIERDVTHSGTRFTASTFIGPCFQPVQGGDCILVPGQSTPPASVPGSTSLIRVIVVVRWTAGGSCTDETCSYSVSTLIDTNTDLEWNSSG